MAQLRAGVGQGAAHWKQEDHLDPGAMSGTASRDRPTVAADRGVQGSPLRVAPTDRLMVIAPHPDDEVLATGGLLQYAHAIGAMVRVIYLTDGESNPWAQLAMEGRWPLTALDRARWGARRREEAL